MCNNKVYRYSIDIPRVLALRESQLCSTPEVLAVSLAAEATNAHVPWHDQTYSNARLCLSLSCISLVGVLLLATLGIV